MSADPRDKILQDEQAKRIKDISRKIREAMRDCLPGPDDQFLTLMIPGKVIDFEQFSEGFGDDGKLESPLPPHAVQLAEAILCDDMPALGPLQLGPTGRSVARSYATTLSRLCPAGSTTGISDGTAPEKLSPAEKRYQHAMDWLTFRDPNNQNKTRVDLYREKQATYTDAFERKAGAYSDALDRATKDPLNPTVKDQREAYTKWVEQNHKTYNAHVQAAYMDWVTMGKKEEVEYYFSVVDNDSAMSRVEASKESMRAAVISDTDGSSEYQTVRLSPQNWAWLAKKKAASGPVGETVESLTFKISRLQKINFLLKCMKENTDSISISKSIGPEAAANAGDPGKAFFEAQQKFENASAAYENSLKGKKPGEADDETLKSALKDAITVLTGAQDDLRKHFEDMDKRNVKELSIKARNAQSKVFGDEGKHLEDQIVENDKEIQRLDAQRKKLEINESIGSETKIVQDEFADKAGIPRAPAMTPTTAPNYWTSISVEVSSSYAHESNETSATSSTADVAVQVGWFTASASVSHQESQSAALKQMANASMSISFECMRVDITRSWLRGELFYDHDLRVPDRVFVSPGNRLAALIDRSHSDYNTISAETRAKDMDDYDLFPMYPTAFLLAANVVLEIHGETSSIQSHLNNSSTSGSAGLHYGPFTLGGGGSGSGANSKSSAQSTCQSTASGCRITLQSPQIIGWISQIIPELPRPQHLFVPDDA